MHISSRVELGTLEIPNQSLREPYQPGAARAGHGAYSSRYSSLDPNVLEIKGRQLRRFIPFTRFGAGRTALNTFVLRTRVGRREQKEREMT